LCFGKRVALAAAVTDQGRDDPARVKRNRQVVARTWLDRPYRAGDARTPSPPVSLPARSLHADAGSSLRISRRIRFSGEMWLNRLDDRPQGNSQTIAPGCLLSGDRSSCDGTFLLKVNSYKLSLYENAQTSSHQVDSFRKYARYVTAFVKHAGLCKHGAPSSSTLTMASLTVADSIGRSASSIRSGVTASRCLACNAQTSFDANKSPARASRCTTARQIVALLCQALLLLLLLLLPAAPGRNCIH